MKALLWFDSGKPELQQRQEWPCSWESDLKQRQCSFSNSHSTLERGDVKEMRKVPSASAVEWMKRTAVDRYMNSTLWKGSLPIMRQAAYQHELGREGCQPESWNGGQSVLYTFRPCHPEFGEILLHAQPLHNQFKCGSELFFDRKNNTKLNTRFCRSPFDRLWMQWTKFYFGLWLPTFISESVWKIDRIYVPCIKWCHLHHWCFYASASICVITIIDFYAMTKNIANSICWDLI